MTISPGQRLGRYRIEEVIGAGGMGVVYRAYDEKLGRNLAIKVLAAGMLDDEAARKRFRNEARVLSRLNHPSIQTIHDFDNIEGCDLLISELVEGTTLDVRLRAGPLPEKEAVRLGVQMAQGLAAAHAEGVLHRDLKPSNLRVTPDGRLKILDFGLATLSRERVLTFSTVTGSLADAPSGVAGTLPYMSPEQLLAEPVDERSDIYSAGVALFEMATGQLPFAHALVPKLINAILHEAPPTPRSLAPKLSDEIERIVLRCLEKDPELRYQSAKDLAADLRRMEQGSSRVAAPVQSPARKPAVRWGAATVAVLAVAIVAAAAWWRYREREYDAAAPSLRWEQLTNFNDAAEIPTLSPDGKVVAFARGPGDFGSSVNHGQIWLKTLPDGDPIQLTRTPFRKQTLSFSQDGARLYFTQVQGQFAWNTYEVPLLGAQEPSLFMANATGLSWIGRDQLLFSAIRQGIHMKLMTSSANRTGARDIYVPADQEFGMVHRSALSPDGKWVLAIEMDAGWWKPCRLVPFDGASSGRQVGPVGACTWAQWSPDGQWMYFTVDTGSTGFHVWRQRFPDGTPQQLTPSGASEEEGLAIMPDGKSLITAAGTRQSAIWLHDDKSGDRQITSEGYAFLPALSPDGSKVYYLRRVSGSRSYFSGELWVSDVARGSAERMFPGLVLTHYSISPDGTKVVFATEQGQAGSGIWIADLDRTQPPRQLTSGGEYRVFFGRPGEIIYQGTNPQQPMRMNEDGSGIKPLSDLKIRQLQSVSPDARWAILGVTPAESHGDRNSMTVAVPLDGGEPFTVCASCSYGFGAARMAAPLVQWTGDGKWMFVSLRYFGNGTTKTAVLPVKPGAAAAVLRRFTSEADLQRVPGAHILGDNDVFPGMSENRFVIIRQSAKTNLFRIYLSH